MMHRRLRGTTLPELIISITVTTLILGAVFGLMVQTNRMYAATASNVEPQVSMMLAIKQIELELRQAMSIGTNSTGTQLEVVMPLQQNGLNVVTVTDSEQGLIGLRPGLTVTYFVGVYTATRQRARPVTSTDIQPWLDPAIKPDDPRRVTAHLFRTDSTRIPATDGSYAADDVTSIIGGITPIGFQPSADNPNQRTPVSVFAYGATALDAPELPDIRLAKLTLTMPVLNAGRGWTYQTLQTQLCLRNMATTGQGP